MTNCYVTIFCSMLTVLIRRDAFPVVLFSIFSLINIYDNLKIKPEKENSVDLKGLLSFENNLEAGNLKGPAELKEMFLDNRGRWA